MNAIQRRLTAIRMMETMQELHENGSDKVRKTKYGYTYNKGTKVTFKSKKRS